VKILIESDIFSYISSPFMVIFLKSPALQPIFFIFNNRHGL